MAGGTGILGVSGCLITDGISRRHKGQGMRLRNFVTGRKACKDWGLYRLQTIYVGLAVVQGQFVTH